MKDMFRFDAITTTDIASVRNHIQHTVHCMQGRRCIDGRYNVSERFGTIARPGGDFGYVMALLSMNKDHQWGYTPIQLFDCVYHSVDVFALHTDDLSQIGCGHITQAIDHESDYDIVSHDIQLLLKHADAKIGQQGSHALLDVLQGVHREQGVLVVQGTKRTVNAIHDLSSYFIYDQMRDEHFIRELVPLCSKILQRSIDVDEFLQINAKQLQATLHLLAAGLPLFQINVDEPHQDIQPLYRIR